jgi:hypothetical protein
MAMKQGTVIALIIAAAILIAGGIIAWAILNQPPSATDRVVNNVVSGMQRKAMTDARNRKLQTDTVIALQHLGQAVEQYIMDHNKVGSPKVDSIQELIAALRAAGVEGSEAFSPNDPWGNLFSYEADSVAGSKYYVLTSHGADGAPGPETREPGNATRFEEDLIWTNGHFSQRPH